MAKYSNKSKRCHRERSTSRGKKGTFISCKTTTTRGRPREGVVYRLTGGPDTPSIARGDTWEQSAMQPRQMGLFGRRARGRRDFYEDDVREVVDRHGYLYEARFIDDYEGRGSFGRFSPMAIVIHPDEYEDVGPRSEMGKELVAPGLRFDRMGRRGWAYYL